MDITREVRMCPVSAFTENRIKSPHSGRRKTSREFSKSPLNMTDFGQIRFTEIIITLPPPPLYTFLFGYQIKVSQDRRNNCIPKSTSQKII